MSATEALQMSHFGLGHLGGLLEVRELLLLFLSLGLTLGDEKSSSPLFELHIKGGQILQSLHSTLQRKCSVVYLITQLPNFAATDLIGL